MLLDLLDTSHRIKFTSYWSQLGPSDPLVTLGDQMVKMIPNQLKIVDLGPKTPCSGTRSTPIEFMPNHIQTLVLKSTFSLSGWE